MTVCTETRLACNTPKPTAKAKCGELQDLTDASSFAGTVRKDVGALEAVISYDARQCTRCEKCARAAASMWWHRRRHMRHTCHCRATCCFSAAVKQHLPRNHHVVNVCGLAACWEFMCWAAMELKPTRHGAQSSFHAGMPVAEQLWQVAQREQHRIFDAVFNSHRAVTSACRTDAPRRSRRLSATRRRSPQKGTLELCSDGTGTVRKLGRNSVSALGETAKKA